MISKLEEFLKASDDVSNLTEDVPVSSRFKDDDGNILLFKIKGVSMDEYDRYQKKSMEKEGDEYRFNSSKYALELTINHTVDPNFRSAELISAAGCFTPEQYIQKKLRPGEIERLSDQILKLSGFGENFESLRKEAKNS